MERTGSRTVIVVVGQKEAVMVVALRRVPATAGLTLKSPLATLAKTTTGTGAETGGTTDGIADRGVSGMNGRVMTTTFLVLRGRPIPFRSAVLRGSSTGMTGTGLFGEPLRDGETIMMGGEESERVNGQDMTTVTMIVTTEEKGVVAARVPDESPGIAEGILGGRRVRCLLAPLVINLLHIISHFLLLSLGGIMIHEYYSLRACILYPLARKLEEEARSNPRQERRSHENILRGSSLRDSLGFAANVVFLSALSLLR